jgi:hypothetical protein
VPVYVLTEIDIYASMGTLVNGQKNVYRTILEAVGQFPDMQVMLSVGRNVNPGDLERIPPNTIVVHVAADIIEQVFGEHLEDKESVAATSCSSRDTNR